MNNINEITEQTFDLEVLQSPIPVLVEFWAPWCGPCKNMIPILEQLAERNVNKIKIVKVNIDDEQSISSSYKIRGIPTQILFHRGAIVDTKIGASSLTALDAWLTIQLS